MFKKLICLAIFAFILPAKAQADFLSDLAALFSGAPNWNIYKNVPYGSHPDETADLYLLKGGYHPAIVFIHGGGWTAGDKSGYAGYYANMYGKAGFNVISINYRLAVASDPNTHWPAQLQSVQLAMRWLRTYAPYWGTDPNRICVFGDSAGGHLAQFIGVLKNSQPGDRSSGYAGVSPSASCVVNMFGPSNMVDPTFLKVIDRHAMFGGKSYAEVPAKYLDASPIQFVTPSAAPTLFIHGTNDTIVPFHLSSEMGNRMSQNNVFNQVVPYTGGHWFEGLTPSSLKSSIDNYALNFVRAILRM